MAITAYSGLSPSALKRIYGKINQYRSTRGVSMPSSEINALYEAELSSAVENAAINRQLSTQESQYQQTLALQYEQMKKEDEASKREAESQLLSGVLGSGALLGAAYGKDIVSGLGNLFGFGGSSSVASSGSGLSNLSWFTSGGSSAGGSK